MLKTSLAIVRTLDCGEAKWKHGDKSGDHRRGQTEDGMARMVAMEMAGFLVFCGLGGERERRIKDDFLGAEWMDGALSQPGNSGTGAVSGVSRVPF